ncbi:MAG: spore coat U domain-containing protein [Rhodobacter sp.]|nr:spore coat U domain-containing protein [Rhodobacter sp.]
MTPARPWLWIGTVFLLIAGSSAAQALTCSASMSNINFGSISVRSGVTNSTSGTLQITCTDALATVAGVCVHFGPGSGGAGGSLSPRYMRRADNAALSYELRATGNGAAHPTWTSVYLTIPILLGSGSASLPVFADVTSSGVSTGTGYYSSVFSGVTHARVDYGVLSCDLVGQTAVPGSFTVSADVQSSCEVDASALNFGTVPQSVTAPIDREASLNVRCTAATDYSIRLDNGQGAGATGPTNRRLSFGGNTLAYGLYQNSARTQPWGDQPTNDVDAQGVGSNQTFSIFGRIHSGQTASPGLYSDAVTVTIEY